MCWLFMLSYLFVSIAAPAAPSGTVYEVYRLSETSTRGHTLVIATVMYEGQEYDRLRYALAREREGRITDRTESFEGRIQRGYFTEDHRFYTSARVDHLDPGKCQTPEGRPLVCGRLVRIYADAHDVVSDRPSATFISRGVSGKNLVFILDGTIADETFESARLVPVERRLFADAKEARVYRIKDRRARFSFFEDGAEAGDTLVVFTDRPITRPLVAHARGAGYIHSGGDLIGWDARVVLGRWTQDGIRPLAAVRGIAVGDTVKIDENTHRTDQNTFTFGLTDGVLRAPGRRAVAFTRHEGTREVTDDSVYRWGLTAQGWGQGRVRIYPLRPRKVSAKTCSGDL